MLGLGSYLPGVSRMSTLMTCGGLASGQRKSINPNGCKRAKACLSKGPSTS